MFETHTFNGMRVLTSERMTKTVTRNKKGVGLVRETSWWERLWYRKPSVELVPIAETVVVPNMEDVYIIQGNTVVMHPLLGLELRARLRGRGTL